MIGRLVTKIFGNKHDRDVNRLIPIVEEINGIYETLHDLTDEELRAKTEAFRAIIRERVAGIRQEISVLKG
jgi:preprotein translocase subunit SecA